MGQVHEKCEQMTSRQGEMMYTLGALVPADRGGTVYDMQRRRLTTSHTSPPVSIPRRIHES